MGTYVSMTIQLSDPLIKLLKTHCPPETVGKPQKYVESRGHFLNLKKWSKNPSLGNHASSVMAGKRGSSLATEI